jgi:UDP-GlcNAc:undecaprenyl-phosphate GlcNAc-1-phosphate transferase
MVALLGGLVAAFLTAILITPRVIALAMRHRLYDDPGDPRRVHTRPIPRLGGVAVYMAALVGVLTHLLLDAAGLGDTHPSASFLPTVLLGGSILFVTGLADDIRGLRPRHKLAAQLLAAFLVYYSGFQIERIGIGSSYVFHLGWLALPITVAWIVGITNAVNLIDGMDGLAGGISLVALLAIAVASSLLGHATVLAVSLVLVGAIAGFLLFNFNPARIFLGDSGSLLVGFMLAVLSVRGSVKSTTAILVVIPLAALALPLIDVGLAMLRRWLRGDPLSSADARHIHHRLLALGLTQRRAAAVMYVAALILASVGLMVAFAPPAAVGKVTFAGAALVLLIVLYGIHKLQYHELLAAGLILWTGPQRARRVIRDSINAWDLGRTLAGAANLNELQAQLAASAERFGFLHMQICTDATAGGRSVPPRSGPPTRIWSMFYPASPPGDGTSCSFFLGVWCAHGVSSRPYGAERVARILAPEIEGWLLAKGLLAATPEPRPARFVQPVPDPAALRADRQEAPVPLRVPV